MMTISNDDLKSFINGDLLLSSADLHSVAAELLWHRVQKEKRKRVVKWRCVWCGKDRSKAPEWEQQTLQGEWKPLCGYCARRRLDNPYNGLLNYMRKINKENK